MSRSSRGQIPGEGERAVALQYSPGNGAPVIVASGMGHLAEKIVEVAVESGVPVYEDNSLATVLSQMELGREIPEELYRLTDIFVPNRHAAAKLAPFPEVERQAEYFLEQGVRNVIITLGHRGCYLRTPEQAFWYDAPPVATVDATGAADAFIAALAVYLLQNYSLEDAVEIASHAAGFCVTKQGVIPALVDRNSLDQYLATRPRPLRCSPSPLPASHKRR